MERVLMKRLFRELKSGFMRYLALVLLIVMGMYIVVGIVASADSVIVGTHNNSVESRTEDGEFTVFIPLTDEQKDDLNALGAELEENFYYDISMPDSTTLRILKNRSSINKVKLDAGVMPSDEGECVLEKRYAEEKGYTIGMDIDTGRERLNIVGIGSLPDYDLPVRNMSDVSASSSRFGLMIVTDKEYDQLSSDKESGAGTYVYSYRLGNGLSHSDLKKAIKDIDINYEDVDDVYFREMVDKKLSLRNDIKDSINELYDGVSELKDGISALTENSGDIIDGGDEVFENALTQANFALASFGMSQTLDADNYKEILSKAEDAYSSNTAMSKRIAALRQQLEDAEKFSEGIRDYTDGVDEISDGTDELFDGVSEFKEETYEKLDEEMPVEIDNLVSFTESDNNPRIGAAAEDVDIDKKVGLFAGVIVMVLFTYVISVFVIHQIQQESSVIGALYAMGVKKRQLMLHYVTLPVIVSFIGGLIGVIIGLSPIGAGYQIQKNYDYFSIPEFDMVHPMYLIIYSVVMPPVVAAIVNCLVINKKLSQTALSLIKNEQSASNGVDLNIRSKNFIRIFQIRQLFRERRTALTVAAGTLISLLVFMLGFDCYVLCDNIRKETKADTKYEYLYTLKYPDNDMEYEAEKVYTHSLSKSFCGCTLGITLMGIDDDNKYYSCDPAEGKNKITISKSVQQKYGLKIGEQFVLTDRAEDMDYVFEVDDIADYSAGLTIFMDIVSMRELFGQDDDYYNALISDEILDIPEGRVYSVTTRNDVNTSADVFVELFTPLVIMLVGAAIVIFCVVMFLMTNVMIDRASFGISLVKIFGFRNREVKRLYLNGNLFVIALSALICIPASKFIADKMYPALIANGSCGMNLSFSWYIYVIIFAGIILVYLVITWFLMKKLSKISITDILKNRE